MQNYHQENLAGVRLGHALYVVLDVSDACVHVMGLIDSMLCKGREVETGRRFKLIRKGKDKELLVPWQE